MHGRKPGVVGWPQCGLGYSEKLMMSALLASYLLGYIENTDKLKSLTDSLGHTGLLLLWQMYAMVIALHVLNTFSVRFVHMTYSLIMHYEHLHIFATQTLLHCAKPINNCVKESTCV